MAEQAGVPIDRVIRGLRDRVLIAHVWSMLFYFLTCEGECLFPTEDEDFDALLFLVAILPYPSRMSPVLGRYGTKRTNIKICHFFRHPPRDAREWREICCLEGF